MRYLLRALLVLSYVVRPLLAARQLILPHPQQIEYGSGRLPLRGASIGLGSETGPEDRFAANELASALSLMAGTTIPVVVGSVVNRCPPASAIVLVRTGPVDALPGPDDHAGADSREAYEIRIDSRGAEIRARSSAGLYYGVQTMRQLVEGDSGDSFLPDVTIHDWPALAYRGFMMDVSHGALPTEDEIKRQIDFLARWKVNQYYLYAEAQIELRGYDLVNPDDRYSQDQIRQIVAYARDRHVDVIPWPNFYGHLHELFRIERYANLSLFPHGDEINPLNEQVQALLEDWTRQLAALFPSPWFNVGFDEQWELSRAKGILGNSVDPARLYIKQLKRSAELLHQLGKRPMFLANPCGGSREFSQHPELISELPPYIVAAPWRFYPAFEDLPDYSAC
ncbi:MAG: glycoside hydrolase, partial [Acidobacteria bacterium]